MRLPPATRPRRQELPQRLMPNHTINSVRLKIGSEPESKDLKVIPLDLEPAALGRMFERAAWGKRGAVHFPAHGPFGERVMGWLPKLIFRAMTILASLRTGKGLCPLFSDTGLMLATGGKERKHKDDGNESGARSQANL